MKAYRRVLRVEWMGHAEIRLAHYQSDGNSERQETEVLRTYHSGKGYH